MTTTDRKVTMQEHLALLAIRTAIVSHRNGYALNSHEQAILDLLHKADLGRHQSLVANAAEPYIAEAYDEPAKRMITAIKALCPTKAMAEEWIEAVYDHYDNRAVTSAFLHHFF